MNAIKQDATHWRISMIHDSRSFSSRPFIARGTVLLPVPLSLSAFCLFALVLSACTTIINDESRFVTVDHYVKVKSSAPAIAGQEAQLYVREVVLSTRAERDSAAPTQVVLFVHGAGAPATVAFDISYQDYSWMAYLAKAGLNVFSLDLTGYGRSTRPPPMNEPCNVWPTQQAQLVPTLLPAPCAPTHSTPITTIDSDWNDIDAVVNHLRALRGVEKVSLVAWSQGGPRAGGYAARNPAKVARLVMLAPQYRRSSGFEAPNPLPTLGGSMTALSRIDFIADWDRQTGCPEQYEHAARAAVWSEYLASDPLGGSWGAGVRRAPIVPYWGFNQTIVAKIQTPTLMVAGAYDKVILPVRVREFYEDIGSKEKVLIDLACSSHYAQWERNRLLLFKASLEWLTGGKASGISQGELKLGY